MMTIKIISKRQEIPFRNLKTKTLFYSNKMLMLKLSNDEDANALLLAENDFEFGAIDVKLDRLVTIATDVEVIFTSISTGD